MTKSTNKFFSIHDMVEIAMLSALAVVLGLFCEIKIGANGGSIGFSMIPLFLISYRQGPIKGFIASGIVYGLITCAFDGYWNCFVLDYLLAYGSIAVAGLFSYEIFEKNEIEKYKQSKFGMVIPYLYIVLSVFFACFLRLCFHVLSGVIIWDTEFGYSFVYNIAYVGPSCLICMALMCALYEPLKRINKAYPSTYSEHYLHQSSDKDISSKN